jgi:hypothetical protein
VKGGVVVFDYDRSNSTSTCSRNLLVTDYTMLSTQKKYQGGGTAPLTFELEFWIVCKPNFSLHTIRSVRAKLRILNTF